MDKLNTLLQTQNELFQTISEPFQTISEPFQTKTTNTSNFAILTKYIFLIVIIIYLSILIKLSRSQHYKAPIDELFTFVKPSNDESKTDKNWFFNSITDFTNDMAGKFSSDDPDPNIVKIWMIYIILGLFIGLVMINAYSGIGNMGSTYKAFSSERLHECFAIAFVFSLNILISTYIKGEPKYFIAMIGFIYIFFMAFQLTNPTFDSDKTTKNMTLGLMIVPIIGSIISKIYYWNHIKSIFTILYEELTKNIFITSINIGTSNIIINSILNKKNQTLSSKHLIYLNILMAHFTMNILTNPDSSIF
jgi:hypothetical protein